MSLWNEGIMQAVLLAAWHESPKAFGLVDQIRLTWATMTVEKRVRISITLFTLDFDIKSTHELYSSLMFINQSTQNVLNINLSIVLQLVPGYMELMPV